MWLNVNKTTGSYKQASFHALKNSGIGGVLCYTILGLPCNFPYIHTHTARVGGLRDWGGTGALPQSEYKERQSPRAHRCKHYSRQNTKARPGVGPTLMPHSGGVVMGG